MSVEQLADALRDAFLVGMSNSQAVPDVGRHGHVREQGIRLEHHADVATVRRGSGDIRAVDPDPPPGRLLEAGNHAQGRGLATAAGTEERDELALVDVRLKSCTAAVPPPELFLDVFELQKRHLRLLPCAADRNPRARAAANQRDQPHRQPRDREADQCDGCRLVGAVLAKQRAGTDRRPVAPGTWQS